MKIIIPVVIALAVGAIWLLSQADGGVSLGGESHELAPQSDKH